MKLQFNLEKLMNLLQTFHTLSGANICVFDREFNSIASYGTLPCFCVHLRAKNNLYKKCLCSDKLYAMQCSTEKQSITYTCHAGIVETITPLFWDGILLGYIIFGALRDDENEWSNPETIQKVCELYSLDYNEFLEYYNDIPSFNHKQMNAYIDLIRLCIQNILTESMLKPNSTLLSGKILFYLQENFTEDLNIHDLCLKFGVSEKTLYKIIRQETGQTIIEYVTFLRIEQAKKLLAVSEDPISKIATSVGFNDYNYFIRRFKALIGVTPYQFRKSQP